MDESMSVGTIVKVGLTLAALFGLIYLMAVLTPWLARKVDAWIAAHRKKPDSPPGYGVRSIYELPPAAPDAPPAAHEDSQGKDNN